VIRCGEQAILPVRVDVLWNAAVFVLLLQSCATPSTKHDEPRLSNARAQATPVEILRSCARSDERSKSAAGCLRLWDAWAAHQGSAIAASRRLAMNQLTA
jgi:hypothetical protein